MSIFFIYNQSPLNSFSINDCSSAEDKISVALPTVPPCLSQTVLWSLPNFFDFTCSCDIKCDCLKNHKVIEADVKGHKVPFDVSLEVL